MHPDIKTLGPYGWGLFIRVVWDCQIFRMGALGIEEWSGRCTLTLKPLAPVVEGFLLFFGFED
jgi:hypothetical protein